MVDNRSAGFYGIGGSFNFKSGDISGTAAKTQDDKMGQGSEYFALQKGEEEESQFNQNPYMDRSAVLRATLNSLAMMNVANVINNKKKTILEEKEEEKIAKDEEITETLEKILAQDAELFEQEQENSEEDNI
ncbi:hypothetical protein J6S88_05035 [bacterium]|nr:hypothetical protein [bacterium]